MNTVPTDPTQFSSHVAGLGESERYWRINRLESLFNGTGYDDRPSFWDSSVPLRERAPAVQSMIGRTAARRLTSLLFGDRVWPDVVPERPELAPVIEQVVKVAGLRRASREWATEGLRSSTVVVMCSIRDGYLRAEVMPAKECTPEFCNDGITLSALTIDKKRLHADKKLYLHRRELRVPEDRVYEPVRCDALSTFDWSTASVADSVPISHIPALWHRHDAASGEVEDIDGHALLEGLEDEVFALDLALSQLHRTALYNGEPQMVRTGVDDDTGTLPTGRTAHTNAGLFDRLWTSGATSAALVKAPGKIWNLPTGGDAKLLESSGAGAAIITSASAEMRRVLVDALGVVLADPAQLGTGELSARALAMLHAPMLATVDDLRIEYGELLARVIVEFLRLIAETTDLVRIKGLDTARAVLSQLWVRTGDGGAMFSPPEIDLTWGEYFEPSWSELGSAIDVAQKANGGRPVLTLAESRALVAQSLGVDPVSLELAGEEQGALDAMGAVISGRRGPAE